MGIAVSGLHLNFDFSINIAVYVVMIDLYYLVFNTNKDVAMKCSDNQVILRWQNLFNTLYLALHYLQGES
ncbi:hypothetical protein [Microbulbifer sp. JMSA003]|uniref:hypothetical protein n=1 Tax=Microbulbifer sp. JMSA003 TaxID=3243369 RepID=UPI00403A38FD